MTCFSKIFSVFVSAYLCDIATMPFFKQKKLYLNTKDMAKVMISEFSAKNNFWPFAILGYLSLTRIVQSTLFQNTEGEGGGGQSYSCASPTRVAQA